MANENKEIDFDNMSDEDFLKLDEEQFSGNVPDGEDNLSNRGGESEEDTVNTEDEVITDEDTNSEDTVSTDDDNQSDTTESNDLSDTVKGQEGEDTVQSASENVSEEKSENTEKSAQKENVSDKSKEAEVKNAETPAKAGYFKLPEGIDTNKVTEALGFYQKITTPFKADGKDFSVRSPEDAIRLMQQGVNYSRRMQEIKPMKHINRMLEDHGLNKPDEINFLIDLSKGNKEAITKLLKNHKIDPMDLDIEKDSGYQANNYQGDPQDIEFRDALDMALTTPEGQALVSHIHRDWDKASKAKLRANPSLLGTLQEFKASGIYDKVVDELKYQQSIGYLQGVPFLQAFDQVGEAMKKAGVFQENENPIQGSGQVMAPVRRNQNTQQPLASGARKPQGTKNPVANPNLSSTPISRKTVNSPTNVPDFDKMSDEDFLKMPPPE